MSGLSGWRPVRTSPLIAASIALLAAACVSTPSIVTSQSAGCSSLIPPDWKEPVEGVDWPSEDATAGDVWAALDRQTGKLQQQFDRTIAVIGITARCEARDEAARARALKSKLLGIF